MTRELVAYADVLLTRSSLDARAACWVARAALEDIVRDKVQERSTLQVGGATMRSLLACLDVVNSEDEGFNRDAHHAWLGLSDLCHEHAYQIRPAPSEVKHLVRMVRDLDESSADAEGKAG
ncbi:hypothetical protein ACMYYO_00705 [Dermacoccaceae bacterium W4C1]